MKLSKLNSIVIADDKTGITGKALAQYFLTRVFH